MSTHTCIFYYKITEVIVLLTLLIFHFPVPSCGPTNVSAFATTSSSILVRWFEVPEPDRNGLILGYKVFFCFYVLQHFSNYLFADMSERSNEFAEM